MVGVEMKVLSVRIPKYLTDWIEGLAAKEGRSKSNLVQKILKEANERLDQQEPGRGYDKSEING